MSADVTTPSGVPPVPAASPILRAERIIKRFGGLTALDDVSLTVPPRHIRGVIGPNGAGKTTLLNVLCGFIHPDHGDVLFNGSGSPWQIYFAPPTTDAALVPGTYENAQFSPDATHPELSIVGGAVNSCTFGTGRFVVDDITTSAGVLQTFSARFEEHDCNGGPALFGAISYSSTADYRTRTVSPTSLSLATTGSTSTITTTSSRSRTRSPPS